MSPCFDRGERVATTDLGLIYTIFGKSKVFSVRRRKREEKVWFEQVVVRM